MDGKMDTTDDSHMEEMKMETESKQMTDNDFFAGLSDVTHKRLTIGEGPSSSCRKARVKSRPKLQWTKSFPPYSQCIGGLGENENWSNELISETDQQYFSPEEEERNEGTERKDVDMERRCSRDELRAKWRSKRKERLWVGQGSNETGADKCDRGRWSGKRRVEETGGDGGDDKGREGSTDGEWKHCRSLNSSLETEIIEEVSEQRERSPISEVEGDNMGSLETLEGQDDKTEEMVGTKGTPTTPQRSSPHPILSKLLHSSSSTSSCSSTNLSSAESDEVFSDTEDVSKKRRTLRKSRSWKTFLTMMHWSLRRQSSWVQLAGHQGNFQLSEGGEVLKLYSEVEAKCLDCLMTDPLRPFVPQYHGMVTRGEQCFIRMEDLLSGLRRPVIMDCKMGVRTYQEEELIKARTKATMRSDMYFKMLKIDPSAPSPEEHAQKGVTKCRYLQWRDTTSSTSTLGFRIEGIMMEDGSVQRDFRKIMTLAQVTDALLYFTRSQLDILKAYHSRLLDLSQALTNSPFFRSHEVIGSSLLFVHDHSSRANVWMIDFGKTTPVPDMNKLRHNVPWAEGSREDGYLIGLTSLITSLSQAIRVVSWQQEGSSGEEKVLPEAD